MPLESATAASTPSRAAIFRSSDSTVGIRHRLSIHPPDCPAKRAAVSAASSNAWELDRTMGGSSAPVVGSGASPAWTASVGRPGSFMAAQHTADGRSHPPVLTSGPPMSKVPSRFGPYELQRRLGAGGMAETFLAVRRGPGGFEQNVCLKRILPAFEEDAEFVRLFLEEARIAARLRHTNIVQVLDFGVVEGSHFLALELVEGLDLRDLLDQLRQRGEAMTSGLVSYLAFELGAALDFAHAAGPDGTVEGVVHRDISPSNVLLSTAGEVKLTDFGIAKAMNQTHVTKSGVIKGKVPYMAPEYALEMRFDARSDLFSLGVTLYEALAGRRPFDGVTDLDTLRRIQKGEHTPLVEVVPSAPRTLIDAVERLIAPEPDQRFGNAAALLDALVDVAPPPTARRILGELVRRCAERKREQKRGSAPPSAVSHDELAYARTMHGTPKGTAVLGEDPPAPSAQVRAAPPDAETRTRLPTPGTRHPSTRAGGREADARTDLDPAVAEAHAVANAQTRPLAAAPADQTPVLPAATATTARLPRRGAPGWAWPVLAVLLAVGAATTAWVAARGDDDQTATAEPARGRHEAVRETAAEPPATVDVVDGPAQPVATAEPAAEAPTEEATGPSEPAPTPEPPREEHAGRPARREPGRGTLNVVVIPFGDVWIDGRRIGPSPVTLEVETGRHVVAAGEGSPSRQRTVQVSAGQTRRVVLR